MAQTEVAILSYKERALVHDEGRNFYSIICKLGTNVPFLKIQIGFVIFLPCKLDAVNKIGMSRTKPRF